MVFLAMLKMTYWRTVMSEDANRIASALERIATALEKGAHINIDHGHIEHIDHVDAIDNIQHGDVDVHKRSF